MRIRRNVLSLSRGTPGGLSRTKYCNGGIAISSIPVTRMIQIAEDLIVRPVLADDVDRVLEGRSATRENIELLPSEQTIIPHNGLRVRKELLLVWHVDHADVAAHDRNTVHAATACRSRKILVRQIGIKSCLVDMHGGIVHSRAL